MNLTNNINKGNKDIIESTNKKYSKYKEEIIKNNDNDESIILIKLIIKKIKIWKWTQKKYKKDKLKEIQSKDYIEYVKNFK